MDKEAAPGDATMTVTVSLAESAESLAVRRRRYVPAAENVAVDVTAFVGAKVTVPGPLSFDHATVSVLPVGRPSSVAVPASDAVAGNVMAWSAPASTTGA